MTRRLRRNRGHSTGNAHGLRARPGFAMIMALGALVVIAVLVAGSSYITLQESQLGQNELVQSRAFAAAEYGLNKIQQDWDKTPNLTMANGANFDTTYTLTGQGTCSVRYTRLNNETFWLVSEGRAFVGQSQLQSRTAVKRVSAILRLRIPTIRAEAAVTTNGKMQVQGSPVLDGHNYDPAGWSGCTSPKAADKPGLTVPVGVTPSIQKASQVVSSLDPPWTQSAAAGNPDTYVRFGDETWNTLRAGANAVITDGGTSGGTPTYITGTTDCNKNDPHNWGEPSRAATAKVNCQNYFPIIFVTCPNPPAPTGTNAACNVHFTGGRGQGILLIDGNLSINGGFEFYGLIVVTGVIQKANGNATVYGSIMAADALLDGPEDPGSEALGNLTVNYSACGIERAMRGSAQVVQAHGRSFVELY